MEVIGKNQDECIVVFYDCNGDVNKVINILLEGNLDTVSIINRFVVLRFVFNFILYFQFYFIWGSVVGGGGGDYGCNFIFVLRLERIRI